LAQDKCGAEPTFVDARRKHEYCYVIDWVDATFPVFEAIEKPRVITIEFAELPEDASRRKAHLFDNGIFLECNVN